MKKISVSQMINRANSHLKNGELLEAEQLYAEVLMSFPNNLKAQQGLRNLRGGRANPFTGSPPQKLVDKLINVINEEQLEIAVAQANNLLIHYPKSTLILNILGIASAQIGQFDQAIKAFDRIITFTPNQASAHYNLGNVYRDKGLIQQALDAYTKALELKPNYQEAFNNLTIALESHDQNFTKRQTDVLIHYQKLQVASAKIADKHFETGLIHHKDGMLDEAINAYKKAIEQFPNFAEAYNNIGIALKEQGKLKEALEAYSKTLNIKPNYAEAYNNIGVALNAQGKREEAIEAYNKATAIKPDYAEAYYNIGNTFKEQGKLEDAIEAYNKATNIKPDYAEAYNNIGIALNEQGKREEAIEAYNKATAIKPDYAEAYNNLSFTKLLTNRWKEGIKLRKWRFLTKKYMMYARFFSSPEWDGLEPIHNKKLLIWGEQGPGDVVIWSSCIDYYTKICNEIIVECHPKLVELLKRSFPKVLVRPIQQNTTNSLEDFDLHIPMETLFGYACLSGLCTDVQPAYLFPDADRVDYWIDKLRGISDRKTVGISWKSPLMTPQRSKNYPKLTYWGEALKDRNLTFVNLQSLDFKDDISYLYDHFGCEIIHMEELDLYDDLSDVAALTRALDCTISVATAAATISAAVGTRTIIPTWAQSTWNNILFTSRGPSVDILQKNTSDSWGAVFEEIKAKLVMLEAKD